jgi:hypothetical protein
MFHSNTELLIDCWRAQAGPRGLPARTTLDLSPFAALAPQLFIAGRRAAGDYSIRLAGAFIRDLHGRDLRGIPVLPMWSEPSRLPLRAAFEAIRKAPSPVVVTADAEAGEGQPLPIEVFIAPLTGPSGEADRYLGLYQPLSPVARLSNRLVARLVLRSINGEDFGASPRLRLAAVHGRRIA